MVESHMYSICPEPVDALRFAPIGWDMPYGVIAANNPINANDPYGLTYVDVNLTVGAGPAGTIGFQYDPDKGLYFYYGAGYGVGAGATATLHPDHPSPGISIVSSVSGGTGIIGGSISGTYDSSGGNFDPALGLGVGLGGSVTVQKTLPIWQTQLVNQQTTNPTADYSSVLPILSNNQTSTPLYNELVNPATSGSTNVVATAPTVQQNITSSSSNNTSSFNLPTDTGSAAAEGGYLIYPNKPNTNMMQSVYRK